MSARRGEDRPGEGNGGDDAPEWTTWLRSRLERVSSAENRAAGKETDAPEGEGDGGEPGGEATGSDQGPVQSPEARPPERPPVRESPRLDGPDESPHGGELAPPPEHPARTPAPEAPEAAPEPEAPPESEAPEAGPEPEAPPEPEVQEPEEFGEVAPPPASVAAPGPPPPEPALVVEMEALRAAVTALVAGVGALADTFASFRTSMNERLDEHGERVLRSTRGSVADIEDALRSQVRATEELGRTLGQLDGRLDGLAGGMEELAATRGDDERWAEVMGRLLDEVDAERQAGDRQGLGIEALAGRLDAVETALRGLAGEHQGGPGVEGLGERLEAMEVALHTMAGDVAELAAQPVPSVAPSPLDDAQIRRLAMAVAEVLAERQAVSSDRSAARPRGRRDAPLRAERGTS